MNKTKFINNYQNKRFFYLPRGTVKKKLDTMNTGRAESSGTPGI